MKPKEGEEGTEKDRVIEHQLNAVKIFWTCDWSL